MRLLLDTSVVLWQHQGGRAVSVNARHGMPVAHLPLHRRDPFDQLIIAQAQVEGIAVFSADERFADYDVELIVA